MSRTRSELYTAVRNQIRDDSSQPRWTDPKLLDYTNDYIDYLWDTNTDAFMNDSIITDRPDHITASTTTLPFHNGFFMSCVHYIASKCLAEDAEEAANRDTSQFQMGIMAGES